MKYFSFKEMIHSDTALSKGINNIPNWQDIYNLKELVECVLDPLRSLYGRPVYINSGYRSKALNKALNGSKSSDHMKGCAADITAGSKEENRKLFELIKDNLTYDQLIDEKDYQWIHVSYRKDNNRRQILHL